jgi:hypothetical protein
LKDLIKDVISFHAQFFLASFDHNIDRALTFTTQEDKGEMTMMLIPQFKFDRLVVSQSALVKLTNSLG